MRTFAALALLSIVAASWGSPVYAAKEQSGYRIAKSGKAHQRVRHKTTLRSAAPGSRDCGLRDHGAPLGSLADTCNQEEFWRRMQERAPSPE